MKFEDVKIGMLVKAKSEINGLGKNYVRENDYGEVINVNIDSEEIQVKWNDPLVKQECPYNVGWWITAQNIEPAYRKSEVVGNYIRVLREDGDTFEVGELYKIEQIDGTVGIKNCGAYVWYDELPEIFTQQDLLNLYIGECDFEYVLAKDVEKSKPQTKTEPKVKAKEIVVPIKVEVEITNKEEIEQLITKLDDKPIVEDSDDETIIYVGRHTIILDKNFGTFGISSCHPSELDRYDRFIGRAVAYYKMNGGK